MNKRKSVSKTNQNICVYIYIYTNFHSLSIFKNRTFNFVLKALLDRQRFVRILFLWLFLKDLIILCFLLFYVLLDNLSLASWPLSGRGSLSIHTYLGSYWCVKLYVRGMYYNILLHSVLAYIYNYMQV